MVELNFNREKSGDSGGAHHCGSVSPRFHRSGSFPKKEKGNTPVEIHGKWPAARGLMAGPGMRGGQSGQLTYWNLGSPSGFRIATALLASASRSNPRETHGVRGLPPQHAFGQWNSSLQMHMRAALHLIE